MKVKVNEMYMYMYTKFVGCGLSGFGDIATLKTAKFPFQTMV